MDSRLLGVGIQDVGLLSVGIQDVELLRELQTIRCRIPVCTTTA